MKRFFLVPVLAAAALGSSAPARAQSVWHDSDRTAYSDERQSYYDSRRAAYDNGFREGLKQGEKDGRKNDVFAYQNEKTFQRADKGYHREYGPIERYRQSFRSGYADGYSDGYQRYAPNYSYGNGRRFPGRNDRGTSTYPNRGTYPGYPQTYPGTQGGYGGYGGFGSVAVQNGANDGYEKGVEDARRNRSFDPLRHAWYRSGDRHYEGRFGSREQYKDLYRQGFKDGYERGFREGRYR
jgi:flagellar biosynthesis/type III secretory pathway protein FliH